MFSILLTIRGDFFAFDLRFSHGQSHSIHIRFWRSKEGEVLSCSEAGDFFFNPVFSSSHSTLDCSAEFRRRRLPRVAWIIAS